MSLNVSRRLFIVPTLGVVAAIALIVVSIAATISTTRAAGVAHQLRAVDHAACNAEPQSWGLRWGAMSIFAYDRTGKSANPKAPSIEPDMLRRASEDGETAESISPELTTFVVPRADKGPCAILRVSSPNLETVTRPRMLGVLATALVGGMLLAMAGTFWLVVLPLRKRIDGLALAAGEVGGDSFSPQPVSRDGLGHIAEVLGWSHARIVEAHQTLEQRNQALENHLAGVAHDLRTPLSSMHLALEALASESDASARQEARRALADVVYLSSMVENLHQATRLRQEVEVTLGEVELGELVRRLEQRFAIVGRHAGIAVAANVPDEPVWATCLPALAERALANLVQNAVEHNPGPGHVAITLTRSGEGGWTLTVTDDGPGLPQGTLARLDEATFLVDEARPRGPELGMLITAEVARRASWSVRYEAIEPQGLRVRVEGEAVKPS